MSWARRRERIVEHVMASVHYFIRLLSLSGKLTILGPSGAPKTITDCSFPYPCSLSALRIENKPTSHKKKYHQVKQRDPPACRAKIVMLCAICTSRMRDIAICFLLRFPNALSLYYSSNKLAPSSASCWSYSRPAGLSVGSVPFGSNVGMLRRSMTSCPSTGCACSAGRGGV